MKKFLSLVLALVMAFSVTVVGFAAEATTEAPEVLECDACHKVLKTKALYNEHYYGGGCEVRFTTCKYCSDRVLADCVDEHYAVCDKYSETCEYCGAEFKTLEAKEDHDCKVVNTIGDKVKVANLVDKVVDVLGKVDWKDLADKVVGAVKGIDFEGIIAKIKPIIEKVVAFISEAAGEIKA